MPDPDPTDTHGPIQVIHRLMVLHTRREGIARRENVAAIQANPEPIRLLDPLEDFREMFEPMPEATPLPGRDFEVDRHGTSARPAVDLVQSLGDACQAGLLSGAGMGAGVGHEIGDAQGLAALNFDGHRVDGLIP